MLNMFKSLNKQEIEIITNEDSLMVKQFENLNITIYGTYENPLFKAKDIGDLLCIKNVRDTILKLDDLCKIKINVGTTDVGKKTNICVCQNIFGESIV